MTFTSRHCPRHPPGDAFPYVFGQAFRMGDVPSGMYAAVTDNSGKPLPFQIDEISPTWPWCSAVYFHAQRTALSSEL